MGQGSNAWHNGDDFENLVKDYLLNLSYKIEPFKYESLDHNKRERPLDIYLSSEQVAIECKTYEAWGSKVQNYCWDLHNAAKCVPCKRYYAIWNFQDKTGKIQKCFEVAKEMAKELSEQYDKDIQVVTWGEFRDISSDGFTIKKKVWKTLFEQMAARISRNG